jgi:predicted DNA-binding transcriptional regulator AlpA
MSSIALALLDELRPELSKLIQDSVAAALQKESGKRYPEKVTVEEASEITKYSKNSLYQMHSKGLVPGAVKVGGKLLFDTAALLKWIDNGGGKM